MRTRLVVALLATGLCTARAQEEIDNPEYKSWSGFKQGSFVKYMEVKEEAETRLESEITYTLKEITREKVILEVLRVELRGETKHEMPREEKTIPAMIPRGTEVKPLAFREGEEELDLAGRRMVCRFVEKTLRHGDLTTITKEWTNAEIPGGLAKMQQKTEGETPSSLLHYVLEFQAN